MIETKEKDWEPPAGSQMVPRERYDRLHARLERAEEWMEVLIAATKDEEWRLRDEASAFLRGD